MPAAARVMVSSRMGLPPPWPECVPRRALSGRYWRRCQPAVYRCDSQGTLHYEQPARIAVKCSFMTVGVVARSTVGHPRSFCKGFEVYGRLA